MTPGGGTTSAYNDPNSPESLMKKTATMNVQAAVDSTYDVKEGFRRRFRGNSTLASILVFIIILILFIQGRFKKNSKLLLWFVFALAISLLLRSVHLTE